MTPLKVGFLILDDIHHVHHLAPIAFELSQRPEYECVIFIQAHSRSVIDKIIVCYPRHRCRISVLAPSRWTQIKYRLRQKFCRSERVIRHHLQTLLPFDALISADWDMDALLADSEYAAKKPVFFSIPHGAGDRKVQQFSKMQAMDFTLLPGEKYQRRFSAAGYLNSTNHAVTGYPKFDVIPANHRPRLFANDKPVIVYNPHFVLEICSWPRWGLDILEYFYRQNSYNFIFAPHRNLFHRILQPRRLPKKYFNAGHMLMDLGSEKSVDMTYTQAADIYLGDLSSQVYEFIRQPRPCLFLNAHAIAWRNDPDYACWQLGAVIDRLPDLWAHLAVQPIPNSYIELQKKLFADTFSITAESAAARGANAIHARLQGVLS